MEPRQHITGKQPIGEITLAELERNLWELTQEPPRASAKPRTGKAGFPFDVLPPRLEEMIKGAEIALGIPPDFMASAVLFTASLAAGATYSLEIKKGATQRAVLYLVLIGEPNSNKSGAFTFALRPIMKQDNERYEAYKNALAEYEAIAGMSKKERQEEGITEMPAPPLYIRSIVGDVTPEALAVTLQDNERGIAAYRDELAGWVKDFNRYHQGSEQEQFLSNWSGIPIVVDRKNSPPIRIPNPFILVGGTIQPGLLETLAKDGRTANGFIDRLLFVWPDGLEKPEWKEEEISLELVGHYVEAINRLLGLSWGEENKPNTLTLSPQAKARLFEHFNKELRPLCNEAESELLKGIYGKFDYHTARLIIPLHLLSWAYSKEEAPSLVVEAPTVEKAIKVAEYFRKQALKVYERLHTSSPIEKLPKDKKAVYEALPETFKTADGEAIAEGLGMAKRTFRHFLKTGKGQLFESPKFGIWGKLY